MRLVAQLMKHLRQLGFVRMAFGEGRDALCDALMRIVAIGFLGKGDDAAVNGTGHGGIFR